MVGYILRRLFTIPVALLLVHFAGFSFAHITFHLQQATTIYGAGAESMRPVWPEYSSYLRGALRGDMGNMPGANEDSIGTAVARAAAASLALLVLALAVSLAGGLALGFAAVRADPPGLASWLPVISTLGQAMPGFTIGAFLVGGLLLAARGAEQTILPVAGFGLDAHLILPVAALALRPAVQVAQMAGALLSAELGKRYVTAARSVGHTWRAVRWKKAMRNILAPLFFTTAGAFRLLVTELVLVEWLFDWPGAGRMLVRTLVPPSMSGVSGFLDASAYLLNPPLVAALLVLFAALFLLVDTAASTLARMVDPRLRAAPETAARGDGL